MKKVWKKPELIIVARSRPEERILGGCKSGSINGTPTLNETGCLEDFMATCNFWCEASAAS